MTRIDARGPAVPEPAGPQEGEARDQGGRRRGAPDVLGHRGAPAELPENTPAAFRSAVVGGAHGVELDTHLSADSVPVVRHDLRLDDGRAVRDLDAAQLTGAGIGLPTLIDTLDAVHGAGLDAGSSPWVLVEIKSAPGSHAPCASPAEQVAAVGRVLAAHPLRGRCVVESFDRAVLAEAARLLPRVPRAVLADGPTTAPGSAFLGPSGRAWADPDPVAGALALDAVAVVAEHRWLTEDLAARTRAAGLGLWAWTVNEPGDARRAVALGASVLVTDVPAALLAAQAG